MKNRILIVDDEPTILKLLHFFLGKNYDIVLKTNGYDAIKYLEKGNIPDLVLLDIEMPFFNGIDFFKSLKISGLYSSVPIIILTGISNQRDLEKELSFSAELIMKKPFNPVILKEEIRRMLSMDQQFVNN